MSERPADVEDVLRACAPRVLGALLRRYPTQFSDCEEATQEALIAGAQSWSATDVPADPLGWLVTTGHRKLIDAWRSTTARRERELSSAAAHPRDALLSPAADVVAESDVDHDDTLHLMILCAHPALTAPSQVALTLRAVAGLRTPQIARAFLVPESTMGQRISRAKSTIRRAGTRFEPVGTAEMSARLPSVLSVLYLIFTEGHTATDGANLHDADLTTEAIRLTRELSRTRPTDHTVTALLALMVLTEARSATRVDDKGALVPLDDVDRSRWDREMITEGVDLVTASLSGSAAAGLAPDAYQLQAAIAACHAEAPSTEQTDWRQIVVLYSLLEQLTPNPTVTVNKAVAVAMLAGPRAGIDLLATVEDAPRADMVRAHLYERLGDVERARAGYLSAARQTLNLAEQSYLRRRAQRLSG